MRGLILRTTIWIDRFHPDRDRRPHAEDYRVDVSWRSTTVLDALFQIQSEIDPSLVFRYSCRSAICGSCCMVINGQERLACETLVGDLVERYETVRIAPMRNHPVIKDLVVNMRPFWEKIRAVTPWIVEPKASNRIEPKASGVEEGNRPPERPPVLTRETRRAFHNADACIMCGACLSSCNSFHVSPGFLGPAALAKAYRFAADPRDGTLTERLKRLVQPDGIWDCVRCNFCVEVCPKDVRPMEQIIRLRRMALERGMVDDIGARHVTAFTQIVRHEGRLNEGLLPVKMLWRNLRALLRVIPLGARMFLKGKVPVPLAIRPRIGKMDEVRRIFRRRKEKLPVEPKASNKIEPKASNKIEPKASNKIEPKASNKIEPKASNKEGGGLID